MSDISGTSITISGDSNDTNLMIHSTSGTITDGDGSAATAAAASATTATTQATAAAASATTATTQATAAASAVTSATTQATAAAASAADSVVNKNLVSQDLANYYKFLIPNNLLTTAVDSSLVFTPHPVLIPTLTIPQADVLSKVQGMNFPEYGSNCFGVMSTSLLVCDMVRTSTTTTPTALVNNVNIQKLLGFLSAALKGEVDLGFSYAAMTNNDKLTSGGGPNALAISDASAAYSANYWTPADFSANHAAFSALKPAIDALASQWTIPGDASYQLFDFAENVHLIHIERVMELSQLADVSWGNSSVNALNTANLTTSPSNSSFMQVYGGLTTAVGATQILPIVDSNVLKRINLAESYKSLIPDNVIIGAHDPSLVFVPLPILPYSSLAWQTQQNSKFQGMKFVDAAQNCGGTMLISLLSYGMIGSSDFAIPSGLLNNANVQKALYYHSEILQAEVALGLDYSKHGLDNMILVNSQNPTAQAIADASNQADFATVKWTAADLSANFALFDVANDAITAVSGTWDASGSFSVFMKGIFAQHSKKVALLSGITDTDSNAITWGSSTLGAEVTASGGEMYTAYLALADLNGANDPLVPANALSSGVFLSV